MNILILGITIFFGVHFVPAFAAVKNPFVGKMGEKFYKAVFSLLSLGGLIVIVYGFSMADFVPLWEPMDWGRDAALFVMPVSVILMVSADIPGFIRRKIRHPMSAGLVLWSGVHLSANGDLASTLIFGCFGAYAIFSALSMQSRGKSKSDGRAALKYDGIAVVGGLVVYALILFTHEYLIGAPILE